MEHGLLTLDDVDLTHKRVLIREDFNVPIESGVVQSDLRIRAALPGIKQALAAGAQVRLISHLGRPQAGKWEQQYSLQPIVPCLEKLLNIPVKFIRNWIDGENNSADKLILYENVRFLDGETENDPALAKKMAALCDVFVMDAFGSAHRAHASTVGVAKYAALAVAGPLLLQEIQALDKIMRDPLPPVVAIIGGSKVSTKMDVLLSLISKVNVLIVGGGMANTFLAAQGMDVGKSLYEPDLIPEAKKILELAQQRNCQISLPIDFIIDDQKILDIGALTIAKYSKQIKQARTILWNGPVGVFEDPRFSNGTKQVALAIASGNAFSVVGGGDTIAAIDQFQLSDKMSYISTGGGAFLEYIEGKQLPAIQALIN